MKKCTKCKEVKSIENFGKNRATNDGLVVYCKPCFKEIKKVSDKKYSQSEKGKLSRRKAVKKYYQSEHGYNIIVTARRHPKRKLKEKEYYDFRRTSDGVFRLKQNIRKRINVYLKLKGFKKNLKFKEYIGLEPNELRLYIESKFKDGMSWENYGNWHIDHIIPLASAKTEKDIYNLNHYTNLQPLWKLENLSKGSK